MEDQNKNKEQLISELIELRQRVDKLEKFEKERKGMEEVLRRSEASYRELADSITDVFFALDKDLRYTYWNKASEKLTGITARDAIGKFLYELFPDTTETRRAERVYLDVLRTQQPQSFVNEYQHGGKNYFFEISVYPSMSGLSVFVKDITERKRIEDALKFTRFSVDNAADTMVCVDRDARFIDVNDAFCRSVGYSREELLSMTVHDIDPDYTAEIWPEFWKKLKQSGSLTFESYHRSKEGRIVPVEITANYFEYKGKEYHCSFARNITERKRAEEALRESEERYRIIAAHVGDIVWQLDANLQFVYVSPSVERVLGYSIEEALEMRVTEILNQDGIAQMKQYLQSRLHSAALARPNEYKMRHKDGRWVDIEVISSPVYDGEGGLVGFIGVTRDITERKRAAEALLASENNFRTLTESATDGILVGVGGGSHVYANQQAAEITGYCVAELLKTTIKGLVHPDEFEKIMQTYKRRVEGEPVPRLYETIIIRKDGKSVPIEVAGTKIVWHGKTADMVFFRDITERKQAEEALRFSEEKFSKAFHTSPSAVFITTLKEGRFIEINQSGVDMFGYELDEIIGRTAEELCLWADLGDRAALTQKLQKEGTVYNMEAKFRRKSGEVFDGLISVDIIDIGGEPCLISTNTDITERKRAEEALRETQQFLSSILDNAPMLIYVTSHDNRYRLVNRAWEGFIGLSREEAHGRLIEQVFSQKTARQFMEANQQVINAAAPVITEEFVDRSDGPYYFHTVKFPLFDATGRVEAVGGISIDITERKGMEEVLRESEELRRITMENILDPVFITNDEGIFTFVCDNVPFILGYPMEEIWTMGNISTLLGQDLFTPDELSTRGEIHNIERVIVTKDGRERIFLVTIKRVSIKGGTVLYSCRDISDHKRAEEMLRESEERFRRLSEASFEGIVFHEEGKIIDANETFATMFGYGHSEVIGKNALDFATPELREVALRHIRDGSEALYDGVATRKDGSTFFIEARGKNTHYKERTVRLTVVRDITDRKRVEEALRGSKEFAENLIDSMLDGLSVLDSHGVHIGVNAAFCQMTGFSREELIGVGPPHPYWPPEAYEEIERGFQKTLRGEFSDVELTFMRKNGERFPVIVSPSWVKDKQGKVISYFATVKDITERKQAEEEKRRLEERSRKVVEDIFRFIPEGVLVFSRKMELLRQNRAFRELVSGYAKRLGFAEDELENLIIDKIKAGRGDKKIKEIRVSRKHETWK